MCRQPRISSDSRGTPKLAVLLNIQSCCEDPGTKDHKSIKSWPLVKPKQTKQLFHLGGLTILGARSTPVLLATSKAEGLEQRKQAYPAAKQLGVSLGSTWANELLQVAAAVDNDVGFSSSKACLTLDKNRFNRNLEPQMGSNTLSRRSLLQDSIGKCQLFNDSAELTVDGDRNKPNSGAAFENMCSCLRPSPPTPCLTIVVLSNIGGTGQ